MYFVLVGGGSLSYYLANILLEEEHEVVVIEKDENIAHKIADELDIITLIDDGTNEKTLIEAGARTADALVSSTESDEVNLVVGMLGKELGAKKVAVRLTKLGYNKEFLDRLGIDIAFHPEAAAAGYLAEMLTKPGVLDLAFLSKGDAEIVEFAVTKGNAFDNKKVEDFVDEDSAIVAIFDSTGSLVIPKSKTKLKIGDKVLVLAHSSKIKEIKKKYM